jgi:hypothetical protein
VAGVSRSGYYKWLSSCESKKDDELREKIRHEYHRLKGIYGYRRMKLLLERRYGVHYIQVDHDGRIVGKSCEQPKCVFALGIRTFRRDDIIHAFDMGRSICTVYLPL